MNFLFNPAQLSRHQQQSLIEVLGVIESENDQEIEVRVIEFPLKFAVKLDDDIEMLLGWDVEKDGYAGLTKPESTEQEHGTHILSDEKQKPESQKDTVDLPEPEPDLSPVVVRVHALARAFVGLLKPLNPNQRLEMWIEYIRSFWNEMS